MQARWKPNTIKRWTQNKCKHMVKDQLWDGVETETKDMLSSQDSFSPAQISVTIFFVCLINHKFSDSECGEW